MPLDKRYVFLFDIDGTLQNSGGLSVESYERAFMRVLGKPYSIRTVDCSGRTDPWIVRAVLREYGHDSLIDDEIVRDRIFAEFIAAMRVCVDKGHKAEALPGVREVLEYLRACEGVTIGLLTGNLKEGACLKLQAAGLREYFSEECFLWSAFGSDHADREELALIAKERLLAAFCRPGHEAGGLLVSGSGRAAHIENAWIIGDSIHDISCARAAGFKVLAVASGNTPRTVLADKNPDVLVDALDPEIFRRITKTGCFHSAPPRMAKGAE
jgi:phosphoglycolate phosphatase-like HAD superfamily hydrolase